MKSPEQRLSIKQQDYLKYVVGEMVGKTMVDVRDQKIWHPYDSHYSRHLIGFAPLGFGFFVEDKFGILPREVELVWSHYKHRIKDENGWVQIAPMNESLEYSEKEINKQKKQDKFIEYVVRDLINDTYIDRITFRGGPIAGGEKIDAPFFRINKIEPQSFLGIVGMKWEIRDLFNDYIKNKYGAVMETEYREMSKIFMLYTEEVKELVKQINPESFTFTDNLDESISINNYYKHQPKQKQLLDYVVKQMVDGTRITPPAPGTLLLIIPEFINAENASPFLYGRYLKSRVYPIPTYVMLRHFKDNYGLLNDEVQLVWDRYREIMYRKLRKEYPNSFLDDPPVEDLFPHSINEARKYNKGNEDFKRIDNPKQHKFYNRIADKIIELIEVRDEEWGKNIFLTDLLDPSFPGQGMSLPSSVEMANVDYDTFQKRMSTLIHDFFPMLEKYWYIDDIFANVFILTRFVFPKLWNKFYKREDQPEESTEYGEHALDYEEKMGKEKITGGSNTSWDDVTNNESIEPINESVDKEKFLDTVLKDMINLSTIINNEFDIDTLILPGGTEIFNFNLWDKILTPPEYARDYMRDTYGLVEGEMTHVWLRYKDIMLDRIKKRDAFNSPFRITESTKPLPDSVFQIIQADLFDRTVKVPRTNKPLCTGGDNLNDYRVNDEENNAIFPFNKPNFIIQINLPSSPYPYNVEMGRGRSWGQLNDYLTQQYGLTHEECERVWDEYRGTICKNAKLPISESEDDEIVFSADKKKEKQQKVLDYALEDLTDNTLLDWGNNPNDTYQIIQFPFSIYPHEDTKKNRLEWIMIDNHYNLDIAQFYKQFKPYAQLMYGLTELEILLIFANWEGNIIKKIRDHSETDPDVHLYDNYPQTIEENKNVISESNIEKLINRVVGEIYNAATLDEEAIYLNQPYFKTSREDNPNIPFDPFRQEIKRFDYNFVLNDMRRFVTYHINKTLGIVSDHPYGNNDPMVAPIAEKLTSAFYDDALRMGYIEENPNIDKQSWYSGSVIKYHIEDRLDESTEKIDFNKIGKVLRDPENSEQIYNLLIDMFPNAKEVIDYNYYGDNEEPNPNDSFAEMKGFLWDIDNNIIKGPTLELASQFRIENEYKQDLEQHYNDYVGGKLDKFFRESPNDPRDITPEQYENMPPIMVMNGEVMDGNHRAFLAQKVGAKLPTFQILVEPNNHPNAQKILSIIHPNDSDEDGIPNRLDISQQPNLNESIDWSDKKGNKYHRNGMVNKVVGDFLKMVELTHQSVIFHMTQHMESPQRTHNDPYLTYIYDENGLTQESKDLLYEGLTNGIQWYMEHTGLIDYYPPHSTNNTRPSADKELIKMIADTLHPLIVKAVTDYNEDEGWTMDTLYDGKFLAESLGDFKDSSKQEQYINYILKHLMDNTKWADASWSQLLLNDYISLSSYINYAEFEFNFIPSDVRDILYGFGVTKQEEGEIWNFYSRWVLEKVMREGNVNWPNRETHKKRYPNMLQFRLTESTMDIDRVFNKSSKLAEKIAKEIIDSSVLSGKLLKFYPPVVGDDKYESPISADVNAEWIQSDTSSGSYHLQDDIRRVGRNYIKKILSFGYQERNDPLYKQVNDIVIDNVLERARNHDWDKELKKLRDLKDKHGVIWESTQPKYLDKIFNSVVKEIRFEDDKYGAVIIPFINSERYSSTSGTLEFEEYKLPKHDRNIRLRTDGTLHNEIKSYLKEIYGLTTEESDEIFDMIRKYIKDELYFRSVVQQILWSVQDDYIQGYGAKAVIDRERTLDLKKYDEFKEYLKWWHGIIEPAEEENISDNLVKRVYDEIWNTLKDTITLNESVQPNYLKKITKSILDNVETTDDGYIFPDLYYPLHTEDSVEVAPIKLKKSGINIHVQPNHILHELFRDKYIDLFGLDWDEIEELYNMVIDEILRVHRLNNLNEIIIGDFGLDHIPSLIIDEMDQEYNLRNYEDYYKLIQDMGYGEDYDPHYDGGKKRYHFNEMGYGDFRPYHEDLLEYLGHHFDFTAA